MRQQRGPPQTNGREQLVDQGVGDAGLALVAAAPDRRQVRVIAEERVDQGGLPDPRCPPDQRDAGAVGPHLREQRVQDAEFVLAPDEHLLLERLRAHGLPC